MSDTNPKPRWQTLDSDLHRISRVETANTIGAAPKEMDGFGDPRRYGAVGRG